MNRFMMRGLLSKGVFSILPALFLAAGLQTSRGNVCFSKWQNLGPDTAVSSLTNSTNFFSTPDATGDLPQPDYTDTAAGFGLQMIGFITPPASGVYTFFLAADDQALVFLSTNSNPANKRLLCLEPNWAAHDEWVGPGSGGGRYSPPYSAAAPANVGAATLAAGQMYYVEMLMKEGPGDTGGASLALQWRAPGDPAPTNGQPSRVTPYISAALHPNQPVTIPYPPVSLSVVEGSPAYFFVQPDGFPPYSFQWTDNGSAIPGAGAQQLRLGAVSAANNGDQIAVTVTDAQGNTLTSGPATLTTLLDTNPPVVTRAWGSPTLTNITVRFSKPVSADAAAAAHYAVTGLTVAGGLLNTNNGTDVILTTSRQTTNSLYTLIINGVRDATSTGNPIAANTTASFHSWLLMKGWAYHKIYVNIAYSTIDAFLSEFEASPAFVNGWPDSYDFVNQFAQSQDPALKNYGDTLEAWLTPPASGAYDFFMINDDQGDFQLSTNNSPAGVVDLFFQPCCAGQYDPGNPQVSSALASGQAYYIEGFHTYGVDAGGYFGVAAVLDGSGNPPAPLAGGLLSSYVDPDLGTVAITLQPAASISTNAGGTATLVVGATGSGGALAYQWQRAPSGSTNFTDISGATSAAYATPPLGVSDTGARIRVVVTVVTPVPKTTTSAATVIQSVTALSATPALLSAGSLNGTYAGLLFNEAMDPSTLINPANYSVSGATVASATPALNQTGVKLTFASPLTNNFTVTVNNLKDLSGNMLATNSKASGTILLPGWQEQDLGKAGLDPVNPGASFVDGDGTVQVTVGGSGLGDYTDEAHFVYTNVSGNFDFATRVEGVTAADQYSSAALMVRQSLDAGGADTFLLVTPGAAQVAADGSGPGANFYEPGQRPYDDSPGLFGWTDPVVPAPDFTSPAYPDAWIRLQRIGSSLLGYRSTDGINWTLLATNNPPSPFTDPVYVGVTASAANNNPGAQNIASVVFGFIGLTPPPPPVTGSKLTFVTGNGSLILEWPATDPSQLQSATNLPAVWQTITNAPATAGGVNYFTNALSGAPKKFYRLFRQN
jgi:hypothetical protein